MFRSFSAVLFFIFLIATCTEAQVTVADGAWSSPATWQGGVVPGVGATAIVRHDVTVQSNQGVGLSPVAGAAPAILVTGGGSLLVKAGTVLAVRGDLALDDSTLTLEGGSVLRFDASASPSPAITSYRLRIGTAHNQSSKLIAQGQAGQRVRIESALGSAQSAITDSDFLQGGQIEANFTDFVRLGDEATPAIKTAVTGVAAFSLDNVIFDGGGALETTYGINDGTVFSINATTFKNTRGASSARIVSPNPLTTGTREIVDSVFDAGLQFYPPVDITIDSNVFLGAFDVSDGAWALFDHNFVRLDGVERRVPSDSSNNYWFVDGASSNNPHFVQAGSYGRNITLDGEIFEMNGPAVEGDCILIGLPNTPVFANIKNCLVLPDSNGGASCTLSSALGNINTTISAEHNTYASGDQGAAVGETYPGHTGLLSSFRSNLAWNATVKGYKLFDSGVNDVIPNLVAAAAADYNGGFNLLPGSNGRGYHLLEFVTGSPGAHDVEANPQFVESTRNLARWDASLGGPGTVVHALAELAKRNDAAGFNAAFNAADLIAYVRGGFAPKNAAFDGKAHDGGDIGAVAVVNVPPPVPTPTPTPDTRPLCTKAISKINDLVNKRKAVVTKIIQLGSSKGGGLAVLLYLLTLRDAAVYADLKQLLIEILRAHKECAPGWKLQKEIAGLKDVANTAKSAGLVKLK